MRDIIEEIRQNGHELDARRLDQVIQKHNRRVAAPVKHFAKKHLWPSYLRTKREHADRWRSWNIDETLERNLRASCQMKPRRTASGVATVTVITKPWTCLGNCSFCPNDIRMPKSYLHDEPACQRAERCCFDPYVQLSSRLGVLADMGHPTDKVELIVLGGTFTDYPQDYQVWFVHELFRALNDQPDARRRTSQERLQEYVRAGVSNDAAELEGRTRALQEQVDSGQVPFNDAIRKLYGAGSPWETAATWQTADLGQLEAQHKLNESAVSRCVGLVVETRPDGINAASLALLRRLGCTKLQVGVQSLDADTIARAGRRTQNNLQRTFDLMRTFGFKTHVHFMVNLPGQTPAADVQGYRRLMDDPSFQPDEVKLYPCALIAGTALYRAWVADTGRAHGKTETTNAAIGAAGAHAADGAGASPPADSGEGASGKPMRNSAEGDLRAWQPYTEDELVDVLAACVLATPEHTRISRMIRDFSAGDIVAGNKKANLRQMVETEVRRRAAEHGQPIREMRMRELAGAAMELEDLELQTQSFDTTNTQERFLQWVAPDGTLAGFLRLSLPHHPGEGGLGQPPKGASSQTPPEIPVTPNEAMIREVHVYGTTAQLGQADANAQHAGLGRTLIEEACRQAQQAGYARINVISAVGTRAYYRNLGFSDNGLYQRRSLDAPAE